ncbi:hypothetical protein T10_6567 [Trichinella papuae]|uniref:Uncharacterized protein n=1 Tax=Trichinella papuae TaxID=268474 RepID=A0A0V1MVQ7_9BILA|nr:hypothetical protein T10_6567 [Trichinella papuae]
MKLFSGFFTTIIQKRACNLRIYLSFHLRNYFDFYLNSAVKSFDDDLFGTYNDMPLKQNPEMIKLQSCLCERCNNVMRRHARDYRTPGLR